MYKRWGPIDKVRILRFRMLLKLKSLFAFSRNMCTRVGKKCMTKKNISSKSLLPLITNQETDIKYHWQIISFRRKSSQTSPLMKSRMTKVQNRTNWCSPNRTFYKKCQVTLPCFSLRWNFIPSAIGNVTKKSTSWKWLFWMDEVPLVGVVKA